MRTKHPFRVCLSFLIAFALPVAAMASGVVLAPGVVVDPQSNTAFLMAPGGEVTAVDVHRGDSHWTSDVASMPLHLVDGALLASGEGADVASALDVLVLDPTTGDVRATTQLDLPRALHTHVDQALGKAFETTVAVENGDVVLAWKAYVSDIRGAAPAFDPYAVVQPRAKKVQAGKVERLGGEARLDLASGAWQPLGEQKSAAFQKKLATEAGSGLMLLGEERLPTVEGHQYLSADGRHVLASERLEGLVWRWRIYNRDGGQLVKTFDRTTAREPFLVVGDTVLMVTSAGSKLNDAGQPIHRGPQLVATQGNGKESFALALRDTTFRGPFPH